MSLEEAPALAAESEAPATVGAALQRYFVNGRLVEASEEARDVESKPDAKADQEVEEFLCEMCRDIPPPSVGGWWNNLKVLVRIAFSHVVGVGLEELNIPDGVQSLHDVKARLLLDKEVQRASREWPGLLNVDDELCFPLSLLAGRCVLVVNVASK
jgi:hypothetical protein